MPPRTPHTPIGRARMSSVALASVVAAFVVAAFVVAAIAVVPMGPASAAAAIVVPTDQNETWAWCGVHPDDPAARPSARAMAVGAGIDVTFGPCNVPTPDYTPAFTANRYVDPITYARLVTINADVGMKTVVYDARVWSIDPAVRSAAIAFWQPMLGHIAAWDMGDEFAPDSAEWEILEQRWSVVRADVTVRTGVQPFTNHLVETTEAALRDLPGSANLLSFTRYTGDLGAPIARALDPKVTSLMCGVNAFEHLIFTPTAASIRADMAVLRAAGCDRFLVFGGQRVYGTSEFGIASLATRDGDATEFATGVLEGGGRSSFTSVPPARLLETRVASGLITVDGQFQGVGFRGGGSVTKVAVVQRAGVPWTARAVALNITVTAPRASGFITVYPCDSERPNASQLNYVAGQTVSASVIAKVAQASGWVCLFTMSDTDLVVDVNGYYPAGSSYTSLSPARVLETRVGEGFGTVDGVSNGIGTRTAGTVTEIPVAGRGGVPTGAAAVMLSVTATQAKADGFLTVFPCGEPVPATSSLNYRVDDIISNSVLASLRVGGDRPGTVCMFNSTEVDVVIDVNGHHPTGPTVVLLSPARLMDTRAQRELTTIDGLSLGEGRRQDASVTELVVAGRGGVASTARAVVLNITVTDPVAAGFVTVYPCGSPRPNAAHLNVAVGDTLSNLVVAEIGVNGRVCIYALNGTHLVVDVTAFHR